MNRKLDWPALLLFTALLFGAVVRLWPVISNGFPLNDGGMFYTMIRDLKANHYILPQLTSYNHADIPFAYPPFGFYIAASLSDLFPVSELQILLWLPALVNIISIFIFYKLAEQTLNSRIFAALAVIVYVFTPSTFVWQVMGGGITRAFGILFLFLFLWQAMKLFTEYHHSHLILTILFGSGAVLSHPQTALHAALGGTLIFIFYGINKRGLISAALTAAGVILLTAPWWATILTRYGAQPFISAGQTSPRTLASYLGILKFSGIEDYLFIPSMIFILIGMWNKFTRREFFLVTWGVLAVLIDPRGGEGITLLSLAMFAGIGLYKLSAWISRSDGEQAEALFMTRGVQILLFGFIFYSVMGASIFGFQLVNTSLKSADLEMIDWVKSNTVGEKTFLLATGREFSMSDPMQEWFPALTQQYSATTMQGLEWMRGKDFFPWYDQLIAFQHCADVECVNEWSVRNNVNYDFLIVTIPPKEDTSDAAKSLRSLAASAQASTLYTLAHESENALIFEASK